MDSGTESGSLDKRRNTAKGHKGQEAMESHDCPCLEGIRQMEDNITIKITYCNKS